MDTDIAFDRFWKEYPRKIAKVTALKSWLKLNPDPALITKIINAVKKAKTSEEWNKDDKKYIPYPVTYLNQQRWEDELTYGHNKLAEDIRNIKDTIERKKEALEFHCESSSEYQRLTQDIRFLERELNYLKVANG